MSDCSSGRCRRLIGCLVVNLQASPSRRSARLCCSPPRLATWSCCSTSLVRRLTTLHRVHCGWACLRVSRRAVLLVKSQRLAPLLCTPAAPHELLFLLPRLLPRRTHCCTHAGAGADLSSSFINPMTDYGIVQTAANSNQFDAVVALVQAGASWRLGPGEARVQGGSVFYVPEILVCCNPQLKVGPARATAAHLHAACVLVYCSARIACLACRIQAAAQAAGHAAAACASVQGGAAPCLLLMHAAPCCAVPCPACLPACVHLLPAELCGGPAQAG